MKALNGYVGIKKEDSNKESETETGIYIPQDTSDTPDYHIGMVEAIEKGKGVKTGDKIVYRHYRNIEYNGLEWIMDEDMICIIGKDKYKV